MHPIHWFPSTQEVMPLRRRLSADTWVMLALVAGATPWLMIAVNIFWPGLLP